MRSGAALGNYKSALQEHLQAARAGAPVYRVKSESGPDHHKRFLVEVRLKTAEDEPGKHLARGMGSTKKNAEQDAARRALERLKAAGRKAGAAAAGDRAGRRRGGAQQRYEHLCPRALAHCRSGSRGCGSICRPCPRPWPRLLSLVVVALFLLTFVLQPYLIPSESMERTLLVGDFVLVNKQIYAPAGSLTRWLLPYRDVARGDIVVFHHPQHPYLVKRVVGLPGDRLRIDDGRVTVNGALLDEPYAAFEPAARNPFRDDFPASVYTDPQVDPAWWKQMQSLTRNGELVVPAGRVFRARRQPQSQQRFPLLGLCLAAADRGPPAGHLLLALPAFDHRCRQPGRAASLEMIDSDTTGNFRQAPGFARWKRIFHVVH